MTPKIYLIKRNLSPEERDLVAAALRITPLDAIIPADLRDIDQAKEFSEAVANLQRPIAILADFETPLTAVNEDGSLCPLL